MKKLLGALLGSLLASTAAAQSPHDPARLFPHEATITPEGAVGELHRLPLSAEVLERVRPDLSDVRIHDARSEDVPYFIDSGARRWPRDAIPPDYGLTPLSVERREGDSLAPIWREVLRVAPPTDAPEGTRWILRVGSSSSSFVRTVVVRYVEGDAKSELARGSVYRFASPPRERLDLDLPVLPPVAPGALLEIELFGEGGYLEPELSLVATRAPLAAPTLTVPLVETAREQHEGWTWIEVARPVGIAPDRIRIVPSSGHFHRVVRVVELAQGARPRVLGRDAIYRVRELEGAEQLEIDVGPARGETLRIEIEDGDSPPLTGLSLEAVVRQPVLVFAPPAESLALRFGGGRAHAPRYDLQAFAGTTVGEAFLTRRPLATLGPIRASSRFDSSPALAFAMQPGRVVDAARFTHGAPVTIVSAPEGLSEVRLSPEVLSAARFDLADLRIVDGEERQWPYLVGDHDVRERVSAHVGEPTLEERRSTYLITPPVPRARIDRLFLQTPAQYLARRYVLRGIDDDGRRVVLARGQLSRRLPSTRELEISFPTTRVSSLELEVEDGSDAPLALERVELAFVSPSLYVAAPEGSYRLLAGDDEERAPLYEIQKARALVLAVRASRAELGELTANPAHEPPPWYEAAELSTWIVWAFLLLTVLVLGILTLKLAREPDEGRPEPVPDLGPDPKDGGDDPAPEGGEPPTEGGGEPPTRSGGEPEGGASGPVGKEG